MWRGSRSCNIASMMPSLVASGCWMELVVIKIFRFPTISPAPNRSFICKAEIIDMVLRKGIHSIENTCTV